MLTVDFKKQNLLGSGAYGAVYSGSFNLRHVAIKRFLGTSSTSPWSQNALREVVAMCSIPDHPHIMRLEYAFHIGVKAYLVFPRLKQSLYTFIKGKKPSKEDVLKCSSQLLRGVSHMHQHGFIHRDLKLENILLDENNDAYIADLGMARFSPAGCENAPLTGKVCSLWTRPPELVLYPEKTVYDERIDSWSLGCVMLALASGKYVFRSGSDGSTLSSVFQLLGAPDGWNCKGFSMKSREERLNAIELATDRNDLPTYFYSTLIDLLAVDYNSRSRVVEVCRLWPQSTNYEEMKTLKRRDIPNEETAIIPFHFTPCLKMKSFAYKKQIGVWIWETLSELKMHPTSSLYSYYCWLRLNIPSGKEVLYAAASCSLISMMNEVTIKTPSTWSKTIGCKVKQLQTTIYNNKFSCKLKHHLQDTPK
jgi:serine/threonine protein kinase